MDEQEAITHFQEQFNGPFPFSSDGILVLQPNASFEEEMQTKIVFVGGSIGGRNGTDAGTFSHENMHQWWGDNVSYYDHRLTFFKEGQATTAQYYYTAQQAANAAGGQGTPLGDTSANLFGNSNTYTRPGISYVALRAILGKDNYDAALHEIQRTYGGIRPRRPRWTTARR
jgi:hypothetical protein